MIYIKLEEKEQNEGNSFFEKIKMKFEYKFGKLKEEHFEDKIILILPNINENTLNKLSKYLQTKCICKVCLSENLFYKDDFMNYIKNQKVKFFDGRWLFQYLIANCAEYIASSKKELLEYQEISILSNDINDVITNNIKELATRVRIVNIITNYDKKFKKLEKEMFEKRGIILNISNNYTKSLKKSNIIFNFDFSEEEINKYNFPKNACIVNLKNEVKINFKSFEGINASFYEIQVPRNYIVYSEIFKDFDFAMLYESIIYKNTSFKNIQDELKKDNVNITFLRGKNGKIRKNEYLKLSKKMVN